MFDISSNVKNFIIFNIYNKKNHEENEKYTIEQKLIFLDIFEKAIIREDFNVHYS